MLCFSASFGVLTHVLLCFRVRVSQLPHWIAELNRRERMRRAEEGASVAVLTELAQLQTADVRTVVDQLATFEPLVRTCDYALGTAGYANALNHWTAMPSCTSSTLSRSWDAGPLYFFPAGYHCKRCRRCASLWLQRQSCRRAAWTLPNLRSSSSFLKRQQCVGAPMPLQWQTATPSLTQNFYAYVHVNRRCRRWWRHRWTQYGRHAFNPWCFKTWRPHSCSRPSRPRRRARPSTRWTSPRSGPSAANCSRARSCWMC